MPPAPCTKDPFTVGTLGHYLAVTPNIRTESPPSYKGNSTSQEVQCVKKESKAVEDCWRRGTWLHAERPSPSNWVTWPNPNLVFRMGPSLSARERLRQRLSPTPEHDWHAVLEVRAKSIPRLMLDGFHWSAANLLPGRGSILFDSRIRPENFDLGSKWKHTRTWKLRSLEERSDSQWVATLEVFSTMPSTVANFDLGTLTHDKVVFARAKDWSSRLVYLYEGDEPGTNFNAVFPDLKKDWWSWSDAIAHPRDSSSHCTSTSTSKELIVYTKS